jgi:hypothetical protein
MGAQACCQRATRGAFVRNVDVLAPEPILATQGFRTPNWTGRRVSRADRALKIQRGVICVIEFLNRCYNAARSINVVKRLAHRHACHGGLEMIALNFTRFGLASGGEYSGHGGVHDVGVVEFKQRPLRGRAAAHASQAERAPGG